MSMFDLKGGSNGNGWNYSENNKPGYMEMIEGTVVEISNPQARDFNTKQPVFWDDGNPKRNLQLIIRGRSGQELAWTFAPRSAATDACLGALDPQGTREQVSIEELLGKFVRIQTQGGVYNRQHPRPWWVTILGDGEVNMVRGLKDLSQQQPQQAPAPAPAQQTPPPPTQFQVAQQAAQQAVAQQNFQQAAPPVNQVPADAYGVYDQDIPFN